MFDPKQISYAEILRNFWESHDPTEGMRQGNDVGTQYRSAIYYESDEQRQIAEASKVAYEDQLKAAGYGEITTEIAPAGPFYYAEDYHQQYLDKNPDGYCGHGGTGIRCPIGLAKVAGVTLTDRSRAGGAADGARVASVLFDIGGVLAEFQGAQDGRAGGTASNWRSGRAG